MKKFILLLIKTDEVVDNEIVDTPHMTTKEVTKAIHTFIRFCHYG